MSNTYDTLLRILNKEKKLNAIRKVVKENFFIDKNYVKGDGHHHNKMNRQEAQTLILEMCNKFNEFLFGVWTLCPFDLRLAS